MGSTTAFVLAGGRSSRMGSDKALLRLNEQTLLQRALHTVSNVSPLVRVVGPRSRYEKFGEVVEDIYQQCGPLGGIHAALSATETELNLILSVDMPLMSWHFLAWMIRRATDGSEMITIPSADGGPQPLCGIYRKAVVGTIERALQTEEFKIDRLFSQVPTRVITEAEIAAAGFSPAIFLNINTREEFERLLSADSVLRPGETKNQ